MGVLTVQATAGSARPDPRSQPSPTRKPAPNVVLASPSDNYPKVHALDGKFLQARHVIAPLCFSAATRQVLAERGRRPPLYRMTSAEVDCQNCIRRREEPWYVTEVAMEYLGRDA